MAPVAIAPSFFFGFRVGFARPPDVKQQDVDSPDLWTDPSRADPAWADIFENLDMDGDGGITWQEYLTTAQGRPVYQQLPSGRARSQLLEVAKRLFDYADIDGDGRLVDMEFEYSKYLGGVLSFKVKQQEGSPPSDDPEEDKSPCPGEVFGLQEASKVFFAMDADKNRRVDEGEFIAFNKERLLHWGYGSDLLDSEEVAEAFGEMFQEADITGDGMLGLREAHLSNFIMFSDAVEDLSRALLRDIDSDGDGLLSWQEVNDCIEVSKGMPAAAFFHLDTGMIESDTSHNFMMADLDANGVLSIDELKRLMGDLLRGPAMIA